MNFANLNDVKSLMGNMILQIGESDKYYNDFVWFCDVNYTTTTEYYGELKLFLEKVLIDNSFNTNRLEIVELCLSLQKMFDM